jgi:hypothetical protein
MIDTVLNMLFRCSHRRLTSPVTPVSKAGVPRGGTYVVCLDCGKQFDYDLKEMRIGHAIPKSHDGGVLPPKLPIPRKTKVKWALWASVPLAVLVGSVLTSKKRAKPPENGGDTGKAS